MLRVTCSFIYHITPLSMTSHENYMFANGEPIKYFDSGEQLLIPYTRRSSLMLMLCFGVCINDDNKLYTKIEILDGNLIIRLMFIGVIMGCINFTTSTQIQSLVFGIYTGSAFANLARYIVSVYNVWLNRTLFTNLKTMKSNQIKKSIELLFCLPAYILFMVNCDSYSDENSICSAMITPMVLLLFEYCSVIFYVYAFLIGAKTVPMINESTPLRNENISC
jgi:hypothetical protein